MFDLPTDRIAKKAFPQLPGTSWASSLAWQVVWQRGPGPDGSELLGVKEVEFGARVASDRIGAVSHVIEGVLLVGGS